MLLVSTHENHASSARRKLWAAVNCTRLKRALLVLMTFICLFGEGTQSSQAFSLKLDSIAEWGKFPRFCINTYKWGARFFNSFDSTYVEGSGKLFNVKTRSEISSDAYNFRLDDGYRMEMLSRPSVSLGFYVTYMAVSLGYDLNVNKMFGGATRARKKFNFQFNCSLFAIDYYSSHNDVGTNIHHMGHKGSVKKVDIPFYGIDTKLWGIDLYYFFNHKHYSQAAAFAFSKIQTKSSGSLYAGLSFWGQDYHFDFSELADMIPEVRFDQWAYNYQVKNKNYALKFGYGYNWVFHPGWALCISEAPQVGIRVGYINKPDENRTTFSLNNRLRISIVYNHNKRWFFGMVGNADTGLVYDKEHTLISNNLNAEFSVGYRFNLW